MFPKFGTRILNYTHYNAIHKHEQEDFGTYYKKQSRIQKHLLDTNHPSMNSNMHSTLSSNYFTTKLYENAINTQLQLFKI